MSKNYFREKKGMKWIFHFIPTIVYIGLLIWFMLFFRIGSIENSAWIFVLLFFLSDFLLSKKSLFGGMIGIVIGTDFISYGRESYTGMETPIGIFIVLLYIGRMYFTWKSNKNRDRE